MTVFKRKIPKLSDDPKKVLSTHLLQITPYILAVGSITQGFKDSTEIVKPYLHIICGDLMDIETPLNIKEFYFPKLKHLDHTYPITFRSLYIKERQLLFSGHTGGDKVYAIDFGLDGSIKENGVLSLRGGTFQGITVMRNLNKARNVTVGYEWKTFKIPKPPLILAWDSTEV